MDYLNRTFSRWRSLTPDRQQQQHAPDQHQAQDHTIILRVWSPSKGEWETLWEDVHPTFDNPLDTNTNKKLWRLVINPTAIVILLDSNYSVTEAREELTLYVDSEDESNAHYALKFASREALEVFGDRLYSMHYDNLKLLSRPARRQRQLQATQSVSAMTDSGASSSISQPAGQGPHRSTPSSGLTAGAAAVQSFQVPTRAHQSATPRPADSSSSSSHMSTRSIPDETRWPPCAPVENSERMCDNSVPEVGAAQATTGYVCRATDPHASVTTNEVYHSVNTSDPHLPYNTINQLPTAGMNDIPLSGVTSVPYHSANTNDMYPSVNTGMSAGAAAAPFHPTPQSPLRATSVRNSNSSCSLAPEAVINIKQEEDGPDVTITSEVPPPVRSVPQAYNTIQGPTQRERDYTLTCTPAHRAQGQGPTQRSAYPPMPTAHTPAGREEDVCFVSEYPLSTPSAKSDGRPTTPAAYRSQQVPYSHQHQVPDGVAVKSERSPLQPTSRNEQVPPSSPNPLMYNPHAYAPSTAPISTPPRSPYHSCHSATSPAALFDAENTAPTPLRPPAGTPVQPTTPFSGIKTEQRAYTSWDRCENAVPDVCSPARSPVPGASGVQTRAARARQEMNSRAKVKQEYEASVKTESSTGRRTINSTRLRPINDDASQWRMLENEPISGVLTGGLRNSYAVRKGKIEVLKNQPSSLERTGASWWLAPKTGTSWKHREAAFEPSRVIMAHAESQMYSITPHKPSSVFQTVIERQAVVKEWALTKDSSNIELKDIVTESKGAQMGDSDMFSLG